MTSAWNGWGQWGIYSIVKTQMKKLLQSKWTLLEGVRHNTKSIHPALTSDGSALIVLK